MVNQLPPTIRRPPGRPNTCAIPTARICIRMDVHVNPGLVSPGVYGDFVMDDPKLGIQAGRNPAARIRDPPRPPAGCVLVSPASARVDRDAGRQRDGRRAVDQGRDRSGPRNRRRRERVFMFQAPIINASGMLESFSQVWTSIPTSEPPFLINGVRRPRLLMRRGEVQNWHFVNAAIFKFREPEPRRSRTQHLQLRWQYAQPA